MASGDRISFFHPYSNEPPASNYATLDHRNQHPMLDFDASTNKSAIGSDVLPPHYDGGGFTVDLHVSLSSATTGNTDWDVSIERVGVAQDVDSDSFAAAQSTDNTTVPGTSGFVQVITVTLTNGAQIDSVVVGEKFRVKATRDAASDTAAGDAELHAIEIKET